MTTTELARKTKKSGFPKESKRLKTVRANEHEKPGPKRRYGRDDAKGLTQDQLREFFAAIRNPRDHAMFGMMYQYGLRASEVGLLRIADVDWRGQTVLISALKGGVTGRAPLFPDLIPVLKKYLSARRLISRKEHQTQHLFISRKGRPISRQQIYRLFERYGQAGGIPPELRHPHSLRHSCGFHLMDMGEDIRAIQAHLRHKAIGSTQIYAAVSPKRRLQTIVRASQSPDFVSLRKKHPKNAGREKSP